MRNKLEQIIEELQKIVDSLPQEKNKDIFQPTKEQIERWKQISPTKKTIGLLIKKGFGEEEIESIPTQYAAHIILNNLKKENI